MYMEGIDTENLFADGRGGNDVLQVQGSHPLDSVFHEGRACVCLTLNNILAIGTGLGIYLMSVLSG